MSDLVATRSFRRSSLYNEFYKPLKIPYIVGFALAIDGQRSVTIARHRNGREFSDSTKTIVNAIRPHLLQAFQNALAVTQMEVKLGATDLAMEERHQGLISVNREGRIIFFSPHAQRLLGRYGFTFGRGSEWLPPRLRDWLRYQHKQGELSDDVAPPVQPLLIGGKTGTLQVRHVQKGVEHLLLLEERSAQPSAEEMISLGLTCRESEILSWVAQGKTNPEIGIILSISQRTVQKHLERIYVKLGVENRTAALSMVRQLSGSG
jgi:DNA-binding CsgD family transcriptional regulator